MEEAIKKLEEEMSKNKTSYVQIVGKFLIDYVKSNTEASGKILQKDKSIMKSLGAMKKEASKHKVGNCGILTDAEGFKIVLKYFGIEDIQKVTVQPAKEGEKNFEVDLNELLK